jgi:hypothetical protein
MKKMKMGPIFQMVLTVLTGRYFRQWNMAVALAPTQAILRMTALNTT